MAARAWKRLQGEIANCRACPRLVTWRERVAREKRAAYAAETYWGRPVPAFGDDDARLVVLGLAPAAHGANRTGRMFTGDNSGTWLYRALHRAGLATHAESTRRDDGMELRDCVITATARCAPPANKPTPAELKRCAGFLDREFSLLRRARVVVALGGIAWGAYLAAVERMGHAVPRPRPRFGHAVVVERGLPHVLLGSYHPSQQNTFTGRLTEPMLDDVFTTARRFLEGP